MGRIITVADLHTDDWKVYNPTPHARLNQTLKLADKIIEVAQGGDIVVVAGDLANKNFAEPKIVNTIRKFFKKLADCSKIEEIDYILAQHDNIYNCDEDADLYSYQASLHEISPKIKYVNKKFKSYSNKTIYFQNYTKGSEIRIPDCDIFIGHVSMGFGQELIGNYKCAVTGDIHTPNDKGNWHALGSPYQLHPEEPADGYMGIIDCNGDTPVFTRISTDSESYRMIRLKETEQYKNSLGAKVQASTESKQIDATLNLTNNIYETISKASEEAGFLDLYKELDLSNAPTSISNDYKLIEVRATNFKSIENQVIKFDAHNKFYLSGSNGAGKTTLTEALTVALCGHPHIDMYNRYKDMPDGKRIYFPCSCGVTLGYEGHIYTIDRTVGGVYFTIDGEAQTNLKKANIEQLIWQYLPFLKLIHYFICPANQTFFSSIDRTQFILDLFSIDVFTYISNVLNMKIGSINTEIKNGTNKYIGLKAQNDSNSEMVKNLRIQAENLPKVTLTKEQINSLLETIRTKKSQFDILASKLNGYKELINSYKLKISERPSEEQYNLALKDEETLKKHSEDLIKLRELNSEVTSAQKNKVSILDQLNKLLSQGNCTCPKCNNVFSLVQSHIDTLRSQYKDAESTLESANKAVNEFEVIDISSCMKQADINLIKNSYESTGVYQEQIDSLTKQFNDDLMLFNALKNEMKLILGTSTYDIYCNTLTDSLTTLIKKESIDLQIATFDKAIANNIVEMEELTKKSTELSTLLERYNTYLTMYDLDNQGSIPSKILVQVLDSLNNDNVRFTHQKFQKNGKCKFYINAEINVDGTWIGYDGASAGQKRLLDLFILEVVNSVVGNIGLMVLDESFANLDPVNLDAMMTFFDKVKVNTMIVTSHESQFNSSKFDKLRAVLNEGVTSYIKD